jgi:hypothetical protein
MSGERAKVEDYTSSSSSNGEEFSTSISRSFRRLESQHSWTGRALDGILLWHNRFDQRPDLNTGPNLGVHSF